MFVDFYQFIPKCKVEHPRDETNSGGRICLTSDYQSDF